MEDFNALAAALGADLEGVRASLILSRDGLVIGAHPAAAEDAAKPAWSKVASLGDPERGFLQFSTEVWCYVRRGPYAAFVLATGAVRPGLLIDQMERVLLAAEEGRAERPAVRAEPAAAPAPSGKPRTTLHREPAIADEPIVLETAPVAASGATQAAAPAADGPVAEGPGGGPTDPAADASTDAAADAADPPVDPSTAPPGTPPPGGRGPRSSMWATESSEDDVDAFSALREFGQLLQEGERGADG